MLSADAHIHKINELLLSLAIFLIRYQIQQKKLTWDSSMHSILILLIALFCRCLGVFVWSSSITRRANWKCLTSHSLTHIHSMQSSNISYRIYCNFHAVNAWIMHWAAGQKYQFNQINLFNYIELGFEFEYASKYPPDTNIPDNCLSYHFLTLCANALDSHRNKEFLITFCNIYWDWILCSIE